ARPGASLVSWRGLPRQKAGTTRSDPDSSGQLFGVDLAAQREAFAADGRVAGELSVRVVNGGCESVHLVAGFAAEAAAPGSRAGRDGLDGSDRRLGVLAGGDDGLGERDAGPADVHAGSGDELARLALRAGTERAAQLRRRALASAPAACSAGRFHHLVDA